MPLQTFTWYPDAESSMKQKPKVETTAFGDGYEQRVPSGLNNKPQEWRLKFTRLNAEAEAILAFLESHGGVTAFNWTTPRSYAGVFKCEDWTVKRMKGSAMIVEAEFKQVFEAA